MLCKNMIVEIGFGPGPLHRNPRTISLGAPYVILGHEYSDYGIPGVESATFDFENPGQNLTFHWFKHNIMCKEHPWICGYIAEEPSRNYEEGESSRRRGSKKSQRKTSAKGGKAKKGSRT